MDYTQEQIAIAFKLFETHLLETKGLTFDQWQEDTSPQEQQETFNAFVLAKHAELKNAVK